MIHSGRSSVFFAPSHMFHIMMAFSYSVPSFKLDQKIDRPRPFRIFAPFWGGAPGFPFNTVSLGLRPTSLPSGILIHPAIWPQYTNVTDRTDRTRQNTTRQDRQIDRQQSDNTGRTVLQSVAQKPRCSEKTVKR